MPAVMKVYGMGNLKAVPNMAIVSLSIITENMSLEAAQKGNAVKSSDVINTLLQLGIPKTNISTAAYSIFPQYDYIEGKQVFRGYKVVNQLSVTLSDTLRVGEIIDNATVSGANQVDNIEFKVADPSLFYNTALKIAMRDAQVKARELGNILGVEVSLLPFKILENTTPSISEESFTLKVASSSTPILPGQINITAKIEAYFYY